MLGLLADRLFATQRSGVLHFVGGGVLCAREFCSIQQENPAHRDDAAENQWTFGISWS